MNHFDAKMSGQAGDAANSLVEGYSKVDFNGSLVSSFSDLLFIEQDPPCLTRSFVFVLDDLTCRVTMKLEGGRDFYVGGVEFVA